ncbi:MAG: HNH endonuclease domain-containing protein [Rhodanobacter sp.]
MPVEAFPTSPDRSLTHRSDVQGAQNPSEQQLFQLQRGCCILCRRRMVLKASSTKCRNGYTREHVFPRSAGHGLFANKVLTCHRCNQAKANRPPSASLIAAAREIYEAVLPPPVLSALQVHPLWYPLEPTLH